MTPRERVRAALAHETTDRVPLDLGGSLVTSIAVPAYAGLRAHLGLPAVAIEPLDAADGVARVDRDCMEALGLDVVPVFPSPRDMPLESGEEAGSAWYRDPFGATLVRPPGGYSYDYTRFPLVEPEVAARDLDGIDWESLVDPGYYRGVRRRALALRDGTPFALCGMAPWGHDLLNRWFRVRGMEQGMVDLAASRDVAEAFFERFTDSICRSQSLFLAEAGDLLDVHFLGDDFGAQTGPLVSPRFLREAIFPRWARIIGTVKSATKAKVLFHSCGAVSDLIPDLLEMGVDILNPVQVTCDGMDTASLKARWGKNLCFWGGGVDTQSILASGTPAQVRAEVRRRVGDLAPGGGFVFTPVHNIMPNVPAENVAAAYDEARSIRVRPRRAWAG
jgi:uroporphyrinogen decarboxylase